VSFDDLIVLKQTADSVFKTGGNGVTSVKTTADRKVEFVSFENGKQLALVKSAMGYPAYYPVHDVKIEKPLKAVLMDLDGTTVHSEHFWIWIIEKTAASLLGDPKFRLEAADEPHVSGHSVSEHLQYCVKKYCPDKTVEEARTGGRGSGY
jgi:beta-phosphoglucomutase